MWSHPHLHNLCIYVSDSALIHGTGMKLEHLSFRVQLKLVHQKKHFFSFKLSGTESVWALHLCRGRMGWRGTRTKVDCCKCTRPWGSFLHQQRQWLYSAFTTTVCCPLSEHSLQRREMRNIQTAQKSACIQMQKHTRSYVSSREHTHTCHTPPYPVFHFSFHLFNNHIWWISIKVCFYKKLLFSKVQFCIILKSKSKWNLPHIRPISHPFFGKKNLY